MTESSLQAGPGARGPAWRAARVSGALVPLTLTAAGACALALLAPPSIPLQMAWTVAAALVAALAVVAGLAAAHAFADAAGRDALLAHYARDPAVAFLTAPDGRLIWRNAAARGRAAGAPGDAGTADALLAAHFAAPRDLMARLARRAATEGRAIADATNADGRLIRLTASRPTRREVFWTLAPLPETGGSRAAPSVGAYPPTPGPATLSIDATTLMFEALPVPILQIDRAGIVQAANQLARVMLDISHDGARVDPAGADDDDERDDADSGGGDRGAGRHGGTGEMGKHRLSDLVEGLGRPVVEWIADAMSGRGLMRPEVMRASHRKTELYLQITLGQVGSGDDRGLVAIMHDATEMKTLEAQFVQSQKMQAIGQLAGGVAHDFNNLLTAISGHCDLLLLRHDAADPDFADLEQINQNANRAASLVGQLLAFSRKQNLRPEMLDLRNTLSDLTHLLDRLVGERVILSFEHDPALQLVRADKRQLEQVIMNLVVNARDAMPRGGQVRISTQATTLLRPLNRDRVTVPAGDYVVVEVVDEGTGIPPDKLPKIFEPFYTTKRVGEGTGLGLSTAYGIVKQTGGYIFADSVVGQGTQFRLYFPSHRRPKASTLPAAPAPAPEAPRHGEGTILLVEDEAPVRAFASRALRMRGYTVVEAEDAEAAMALLEDPALHVDVFVTDVIMPGMDGPTWVRQALKGRPATKVIFMSGYAEESFADAQAGIPDSVFLPKPFSLVELTSTVAEIMS